MSNFDLNKPCSEQGLSPDQVKLCQEARKETEFNKSRSQYFKRRAGEKKGGFYGQKEAEKTRQEIKEFTEGNDKKITDYYLNKYGGKEKFLQWDNYRQLVNNSFSEFDDQGKGDTVEQQEIINDVLANLQSQHKNSLEKYLDQLGINSKTKNKSNRPDSRNYHHFYKGNKNEEKYQEFLREAFKLGADKNLFTQDEDGNFKVKKGFNAATFANWLRSEDNSEALTAIMDDKIQEEFDQDLIKRFNFTVDENGKSTQLENFKGSGYNLESLSYNNFKEADIDAAVRDNIFDAARRIFGKTGESEIMSIIAPGMEKYLNVDFAKGSEKALENNLNEKLRFQELGCGGEDLADSLPLGQKTTVECNGVKHTFELQSYRSEQDIQKDFFEQNKDIEKRYNSANTAYENALKDSKNVLNKVNDLQKKLENYGTVTKDSGFLVKKGYSDLMNQYKIAIEEYNSSDAVKTLEIQAANLKNIGEEYKLLSKKGEELEDYGMLLEAGALNYNLWDKTLATIDSQFLAGAGVMFGSLGSTIASALGNEEKAKQIQESSLNYYKQATEKMGTFSESLGSSDFGKEGFGFGRYLLNLAADNSFSIGATLLPGGVIGSFGGKLVSMGLRGAAKKAALASANKLAQNATMATFFVSGSGDQWGKLSLAEFEGKKKIENLKNDLYLKDADGNLTDQINPDLTQEMKNTILSELDFYENATSVKVGEGAVWRRAFAAIGYGGMDMIGERLGSLRVISNLQKVGKAYKARGLFSAYRKSMKFGVTETLKSGYRFGAGIGSELLEESFVNLGTAFIDKNVMGLDVGYLDQFSTDFALNTAFTSIALQSPYMASNVMSGVKYELATAAHRKSNRSIHGKLMGITTKLENAKLPGSEISKEEIARLEQEKADLFEQANVSDFVTMNAWTKLDATERQNLIDVNAEIRTLEKDYYSLTNNPNFGEKGLLNDIQDLETKLKAADGKKADILKNKKLTEYNKHADNARKENKELQTVDGIIAEGRSNFYEASLDIATFQFDGETTVLTDQAAIDNYIKDPKNKIDPSNQKTIDGINNNSAFVNPKTGQLVVNQGSIFNSIMLGTTSQALTAAVSPLHELLHAQIKSAGLFNVENTKELQESINTATLGLTELVQNKIDSGDITDQRGKEILDRLSDAKKENIEEVMTVFGETVLLGDIKPNEMNAAYGLKGFLNKTFTRANPNVSNVLNPFKTTNDIYSFVSDFATRTANVEGGKVQNLYTFDSTGRAKAREDVDIQEDLSFSKEIGRDIKSQLDQFVQNEDGSRKYESKEDFQKSNDAANAMNQIENTNLLDGLIRQNVSQEYLDMNPEFIQDAKQRIGEKFLAEFDPSKNESLFGWLTGPTVGGQAILGFAKGDVQNKGKQQVETRSIDDPKAKEVAEQKVDETTTTKKEVSPTIEVFDLIKKSDPSFDSKKFEKEFTDGVNALAKEKGINLSDPNLTPKQRMDVVPYKVLADAIGIPVKKLTDPKANLTPSEASKAQRILTAAKPFIKNVVLSKANTDVTTVESKKKGGKPVKVGGDTLGLGTKILNTFFNPPKRLGSGKKVRTPKQFDNKKFDEAIGVKDGKVSPDFDARNSQIIKGLLKAVAEQMSGRATSRTLDAGPQTQEVKLTQAQLDSMKSPLVFSKAPINITTKIPKFPNTPEGKTQYTEFLQKTFFPLFPKSLFLQGKNTVSQFTGAEKSASNSAWGMKPGFTNAEIRDLLNNPDQIFGKPFPKKVNLKYINKVYNQIFPNGWDSMLEMHNSGELKTMNDSNALLGKVMWNRIYKAIRTAVDTNDQNSLQGIMTYLGGTSKLANHPMKMIAPVVGGNFDYKAGKEGVTYEHARPASDTYNVLVNAAIAYKSKTSFDKVYAEVMQNYKVIGLKNQPVKVGNKTYENPVDAVYPQSMPKGVTEWNRRYANPEVAAIDGGIDVNNLYLFDQGKVFSDAFNMDAAGKPLTKEGKKIAKDSTRKYQTLDNGIKFSQSPIGKKAIEKRKAAEDKNVSKTFNDIIEENKGVKSEKRFSEIVAKRRGSKIGRFKFFLPPGAEDFKGLIYTFLGKGKKGEQQFEFFDRNLIRPYQQAVAQIERFRRALKSDYATLLRANPDARKKLGKKIPTKGKTDFTYDQAVRAYLMDKSGFDLVKDAGLSKRDAKILVDAIAKDQTMLDFAQGLQMITKQDTWLKPNAGFDVQTIESDLQRLTQGEGRKKFLENSGFMQNSGEIFSQENLRKIEATYGRNTREALEDMMYRMKNGTNRPSGSNRLVNSFNNWVNRSIGAIMFFNRKSALLQTISSVNFINWSDNNPLMAAKAFANQKQYWTDFAMIFNSPKLKERRAGLKGDINEAELAKAVEGATNKAEAALSWLLKKGFLPTQMADSFAIATGGATFYRNRVNTYTKQGMDQKAAEEKAFEDFSRVSEESQQSADPSMISEQQASVLGRLILSFQNTPMQYTRLMKRSAQDLLNGRGDAKTHVSKIIYYGAIQNFIFSALQNALFATIPGFSGEEEEDEETKKQREAQNKHIRIANNMVDTVLRGSGIYGAIGATLKNTLVKFYQNEGKDPFAKDNADILLEAVNLSPPIGSKLRKLNNALKTREFEKDVIEERGWEITRDGRVNLSPSYRVLGSTAEAVLNIPLERTIAEISALTEMTDSRNSSMERIALALGWRTWDLGIRNEEHDQIKLEAKERKKEERKKKLQFEREEKKRLEEEKRFEGLSNKEINNLKRRDQIESLTKQQQVDSLVKLGVSKALIRSLRLESDRIDKIIELNTK